jgi:hypothetical protein
LHLLPSFIEQARKTNKASDKPSELRKLYIIDISSIISPVMALNISRTSFKSVAVIGSMYPEKITFEELEHRTANVDFLFQCIYQINNKLQGKKGKRPF